MDEEENFECARLEQEKLRTEGERRLRETELARQKVALRKRRAVSPLTAALVVAGIGLVSVTLGTFVSHWISSDRERQRLEAMPILQAAEAKNQAQYPESFPAAQSATVDQGMREDSRMAAEGKRFTAYLQKLGLRPLKGALRVEIVNKMPVGYEDYISHYEWGTTYILAEFSQDSDVLLKEYAHFALQSDDMHRSMTDENTEVFALEDGLTTYFPCSFNNHALWGEASEKKGLDVASLNLNNKFTFEDQNEDKEKGELIWGGAFWDLRRQLGRDTTDKLLLAAWQSLQPSDSSGSVAKAFVNNLLMEDQRLEGGQHADVIRSVFQKRKLIF